jgi:hypothetical protein
MGIETLSKNPNTIENQGVNPLYEQWKFSDELRHKLAQDIVAQKTGNLVIGKSGLSETGGDVVGIFAPLVMLANPTSIVAEAAVLDIAAEGSPYDKKKSTLR